MNRQLLTFTARFYGSDESQEFESLSRSDAFGMATRYAAENGLMLQTISQVNDADTDGENDCG